MARQGLAATAGTRVEALVFASTEAARVALQARKADMVVSDRVLASLADPGRAEVRMAHELSRLADCGRPVLSPGAAPTGAGHRVVEGKTLPFAIRAPDTGRRPHRTNRSAPAGPGKVA